MLARRSARADAACRTYLKWVSCLDDGVYLSQTFTGKSGWSRPRALQVLAGVRIVFSRVIPLDQPPQQHELWRRAEQFGAICSERADASVTHVISKALGTQKVHAPPHASASCV